MGAGLMKSAMLGEYGWKPIFFLFIRMYATAIAVVDFPLPSWNARCYRKSLSEWNKNRFLNFPRKPPGDLQHCVFSVPFLYCHTYLYLLIHLCLVEAAGDGSAVLILSIKKF